MPRSKNLQLSIFHYDKSFIFKISKSILNFGLNVVKWFKDSPIQLINLIAQFESYNFHYFGISNVRRQTLIILFLIHDTWSIVIFLTLWYIMIICV